ncbi:transcriptional regulator, XRE family with cupin sensor [Shimia gijangensis]|uniref:Transcriptional regulator, XRE family with cupin sensor n=1 Tax=Shimia gijangensis TaxID=1470563 RepID=A0A1M6JNU8_9RHOB|nr:cupin domain-containing protein [Shimia gijangensis]SHJ48377.1 transcriptional regulator, XRE family with cupin sensor [Shimia gijangensis]
MLSDVLSEGLGIYQIGPKIRFLRTAKSLGLAQLGDHTGLSAGMLSKIERGQVTPTLPTLMKIALVFGVGLEHFFQESEEPTLAVIRAKKRIKLPNTTEVMPSYYFESLDFAVNDRPIDAYLVEFMPRTAATVPHEHSGIELVYVLSGEVKITIHNEVHELGASDSMYFDSQYPHTYKCGGQDRASAIVVAAKECG